MRDSLSYASKTLAVICIGAILLCLSALVSVKRALFLCNATSSEATIVSVSYEYVPAGRGSKLAYVPTVELEKILQPPEFVKVDTYNEDPIYSVGSKLPVLCDSTGSSTACIEDSAVKYLEIPIGALLIGAAFLAVGLYRRRRALNEKLKG